MLWVFANVPTHIAVYISSDSEYVWGIARFGATDTNAVVGTVLANIVAVVMAAWACELNHVCSFEGHQWHELADSAAKFVTARGLSPAGLPNLSEVLQLQLRQRQFHAGPTAWLWLALAIEDVRKAYPCIEHDAIVVVEPCPSEHPAEALRPPAEEKIAKEATRRRLTVVSFNVFTIGYSKDSKTSAEKSLQKGVTVTRKMAMM